MYADPVAEVEPQKLFEPVVADDGLGDEQLHFVIAVANRREDQLARISHQHHAPGDRNLMISFGAGWKFAVRGAQLGQCDASIEAQRVRIAARIADVGEFLQALGLLGDQSAAGTGVDGGVVAAHDLRP